jgi:fluoroquinolone resistance protein
MTIVDQPQEMHFQETFTALSLGDETLDNRIYDECVFNACSFIGTKLSPCRFTGCKFNDCTLSAVILLNSRFSDVSFTSCKAIGIDWTRAAELRDIVFKSCQLNYSNFKLLKIPGIKMTDCEVKEADFTEADLSKADLKNTDFEKTRFLKTNLSGADFKGARNYSINVLYNTLKKTKFSYPEVLTLLNSLDIVIE